MTAIETAAPVHIWDLVDLDQLDQHIDNGLVTRRRHPDMPLDILTYSPICQGRSAWDGITRLCRGLVVHRASGRVIARPFEKWFNYGEHVAGRPYAPPLPTGEPFELFDKVDGSLIIIFWFGGQWHTASKGSFTSDQALWAGRWLAANPLPAGDGEGVTLLAEAVYPNNRIVVDHQGAEGLVFLAGFTTDGDELPFDGLRHMWPGPVVRRWPSSLPLADIAAAAAGDQRADGTAVHGTDAEGYIVRFASGTRVKVKFADYLRLHRLLAGTTARDVWRHHGADMFHASDLTDKELAQLLRMPLAEAITLRRLDGNALGSLLNAVPAEFSDWVHGTRADLETQLATLLYTAAVELGARSHLRDNRKEFSASLDNLPLLIRGAILRELDGYSCLPALWRSLRPEHSLPFRTDEES